MRMEYKTDSLLVPVSYTHLEEVVAAIRGQEQDDAAYERRKFRHKAHYSLNREDGIENDALNRPLTPAEVLEQKLLREEVYAALMQLTAIQARRIYARFYLGMTVAEIARIEGADRRRVWESIRRGLKDVYKRQTLGLETRWYVSDTPAQLKHLFSELYSAAETEPIGYFKIKAIELLYHMDQLTQINGCDLKYFDKKQIQTTKAIREYLISHLDEKVSLEQLAKEAHLNLSVFHLVRCV